jgi:hypothetical protein
MSFFRDAWNGLTSLVTGKKFKRVQQRREEMQRRGIQPAGPDVSQMKARDFWQSGIGNMMALASGDLARKTRRGRTMGAIGEGIGKYGIEALRRIPGSQIERAENVFDVMRGGPTEIMRIAAENAGSAVGNRLAAAAMSVLGSAACGGRVSKSGMYRVHKGEVVVKKRGVRPLIKLIKQKGVALPLSAIKVKAGRK